MRTTFRERLCLLRDMGELAGTEISRLAGLSPASAGHLLTGRREFPETQTAIALASLFGVTTDYLLTGVGPEPTADSVRAAVERARRAQDPNTIADDAAPLAAVG